MSALAKNSRDITGQKFGKLLAVKRIENIEYVNPSGQLKKRSQWVFKCDCGSEIKRAMYLVVSGNTRSCGCMKDNRLIEYNYANKRLGYGVSAKKSLLKRYQIGARNRGISWELDESNFSSLTSGDCYYCGKSPGQVAPGMFGSYVYNGIDRKNNDLPYTKENSVSCCGPCNLMKMDLTDDAFVRVCERIYKKNIGDLSYVSIKDDRKLAINRNHYRKKKSSKV